MSAYYVNLSFRKVAERQCCGKEGRDLTHCWTLIYIESAIELLYWDSVICTVEQIPAVKSNCLSLLTIASLICAQPLHTPQNYNSLQIFPFVAPCGLPPEGEIVTIDLGHREGVTFLSQPHRDKSGCYPSVSTSGLGCHMPASGVTEQDTIASVSLKDCLFLHQL